VVTDENDLMIINKSGILIRLNVSEVRVMGRATQGVRLINLTKKNDTIASVCKVQKATEEELAEENAENAENAEAPEVSENSENKE
jgi:DNA gyrase subunit A